MYRYVILVFIAIFALATAGVLPQQRATTSLLQRTGLQFFRLLAFKLNDHYLGVTLLIILFVRISTRNIQFVPGRCKIFWKP